MDAVLFLKEWERMCETFICECDCCPLHLELVGSCRTKATRNPEKAIEIVKEEGGLNA